MYQKTITAKQKSKKCFIYFIKKEKNVNAELSFTFSSSFVYFAIKVIKQKNSVCNIVHHK